MSLINQPRIPKPQILDYANRYASQYDETVQVLVGPVKGRGHLEKADLVVLAEWKSPRVRSRIALNDPDEVVDATRLALASESPRLALHILTALHGIQFPIASTVLHWFHRDRFPIIDFRALWSLGIDTPGTYTLEFWERYVEATRDLSGKWGVDMRTLDRALWQYSKDNQ